MNNPYNVWQSPHCQNMGGFNGPPRPNWSPYSAQAPHMAPSGLHFAPPMYQSYPNSFCGPNPPMGNQWPPSKFAQHQFPPNQNDFNNPNQNGFQNQNQNGFQNQNQHQHSGVNNKSNQYGSSPQPNQHQQNSHQRDKKPGNQNQHLRFNESNKNQNGNQNGKKKAKNKPNKRELPENSAFYCDSCDRGFKTEDKLTEHVDGHEQCKEEGCSYIAAPKLVQLHVRNHHQTGLAKKIWSVESQEDIAKWIADRKKKFPTAVNIEKKKEIQAEKIARGEVLDEKQFHHRANDQRQRRKEPWWKKRKNNDDAQDSPPEKKQLMEEAEKNEVDDDKQICDKKETEETTESSDPLSTILNSDLENPSNDADLKEETKASSATSESPLLPTSLKALQATYNSDEEEEDVKEVKNPNENSEPATKPPCNTTVLKEVKNCRNHHQRSGNQGRHEAAKELAKRPWHSKVFKRERPTLLEKILAKEIRHERNVILQCIRHIVTNNFFEKPISVCPDE